MEGIVVDLGQRAGPSQQLNHDPPPVMPQFQLSRPGRSSRRSRAADPDQPDGGHVNRAPSYLLVEGASASSHHAEVGADLADACVSTAYVHRVTRTWEWSSTFAEAARPAAAVKREGR